METIATLLRYLSTTLKQQAGEIEEALELCVGFDFTLNISIVQHLAQLGSSIINGTYEPYLALRQIAQAYKRTCDAIDHLSTAVHKTAVRIETEEKERAASFNSISEGITSKF